MSGRAKTADGRGVTNVNSILSLAPAGVSSLMVRRRPNQRIRFLLRFGLSCLEVRLAKAGGFCRVGSSFHFGFLDEVAPALVTVHGALGIL